MVLSGVTDPDNQGTRDRCSTVGVRKEERVWNTAEPIGRLLAVPPLGLRWMENCDGPTQGGPAMVRTLQEGSAEWLHQVKNDNHLGCLLRVCRRRGQWKKGATNTSDDHRT